VDAKGVARITKCIGKGPGGDDGFLSTKIIGEKQASGAREIWEKSQTVDIPTNGSVQYRHVWIDMSNVTVPLSGGKQGRTCKPAMGQSFAAGTTDGPGVDGMWQGRGVGSKSLSFISHVLDYILSPGQKLPEASEELQACQSPKYVLLATGEVM